MKDDTFNSWSGKDSETDTDHRGEGAIRDKTYDHRRSFRQSVPRYEKYILTGVAGAAAGVPDFLGFVI